MSITQIDFGTTKELTAAVRSLYDPDKKLPEGSVLTFMRLTQTDNDSSTLTAYLNGEAWFERFVNSQGIIGTTYLFDADDLLTRVNEKLDVWKLNGLRVTQTPSSQMKVDCILPNSKRLKLTNNVLIGTFNGDEAEFEDRELKAQEYEYETLAEIHEELVLDLFHAIALCDSFSTLKADTTEKEAWLWCRKGNLYLAATERDGSQGTGLICVFIGTVGGSDWDLGVKGRHLTRTTFVSKPIYSDEEVGQGIKLKYSKEGKRFHIVGKQGHANIPTVDGYKCRALSQAVGAYFFKEGRALQLEEQGYRIFDLQELINAIQICTPKKNATRKDIVVEFIEGKAVLYKRSDNKKSERAEVIPPSTDGLDTDWMPIVVDHSYLTDAVKALKTYTVRQQKLEGGSFHTDFDFEEEIEEEEESAGKMFVKLTQVSNSKVAGHHSLYLQPLNRDGCVIVLMVQTKERTEDLNESD